MRQHPYHLSKLGILFMFRPPHVQQLRLANIARELLFQGLHELEIGSLILLKESREEPLEVMTTTVFSSHKVQYLIANVREGISFYLEQLLVAPSTTFFYLPQRHAG